MPTFRSPTRNTAPLRVAISLLKNHKYISVHFPLVADQQAIVIAILSPLPLIGFEEKPDELLVHFSTDAFEEQALKEQLDMLPFPLPYHLESQEEKNWNAQWESSYRPVLIGDFCGIRASFHPCIPSVSHELIVHPQMSFGTGHHETTQLMIRLMKGETFHQQEVLDMGSGTGVLGILAEKMGAKHVLCMDIDSWCIENALENCELNQTARVTVRLREENWRPESEQYDRILANINRNILLKDIPLYVEGLKKGGNLLLSGFYENDCAILMNKLAQLGMKELRRKVENDWTALLLQKN